MGAGGNAMLSALLKALDAGMAAAKKKFDE
jgi:hypothetical protein